MIIKKIQKIKQLYVVVGMQRGGIGVTTRSLKTLGIYTGSNLIPPVQGNNDKGFFEDLDIVALSKVVVSSDRQSLIDC
jgi:hypothetical protein